MYIDSKCKDKKFNVKCQMLDVKMQLMVNCKWLNGKC